MDTQTLSLDLPKAMEKALQIVQRMDSNAIIAGDALRDTLLGRPVEAIDIFVGPGYDHRDLRDAFIDEPSPDVLAWDVNRHDFADEETDCVGCFQDSVSSIWLIHLALPGLDGAVDDHAVRVVVLTRPPLPADHLSQFDLAFCRIAHDGARAFATGECLETIERKSITVALERTDTRVDMSLRRAKQIRADKYPDWTIETPWQAQPRASAPV